MSKPLATGYVIVRSDNTIRFHSFAPSEEQSWNRWLGISPFPPGARFDRDKAIGEQKARGYRCIPVALVARERSER